MSMALKAESATSQQPLKGVVLCTTALSQEARTRISSSSTELGAKCYLDLTYEVTHLLVGSITTPKYRWVARNRTDIKALKPEWIDAVVDVWKKGEDIDIAALEKEYRVPTFFGLLISVTGFYDTTQRDHISDRIEKHGAAYHGDLTKQCTHLVAAVPQGAKYSHANMWGIKVVSLKWFEDSLRRGMALDEKLYDPLMSVEEQGHGAWKEAASGPRLGDNLGKRGRESESQTTATQGGKRKLRRTASTRLSSQSQDLLQGMSVRDSISAIAKDNQWDDDRARSVSAQPTSTTTFEGSDRLPTAPEQPVFAGEEPAKPRGLFSGLVTAICGFDEDRRARLAKVLEQNGATVVRNAHALKLDSDHPFSKHPDTAIIVPRASPVDLSITETATLLATEWWVERCLHYKTRLDPSVDLLSQPLHGIVIPEFKSLKISSTGFTGVDLRQFAEAAQLMGAKYEEQFNPSVSVLVSATESIKKEKAWYANREGIPVVSAEWFWTTLRTRAMAAYDDFKVPTPSADIDSQTSTSSPTQSERQPRPAFSSRRSEPSIRLSNTRRKHATPSLPLQTSRPTARPQRSLQPFVHEDDDDDDDDGIAAPARLEGAAPDLEQPDASAEQKSHPLQELDPNASPRKENPLDEDVAVVGDTLIGDDAQKAMEKYRRLSSDSKTASQTLTARQTEPEVTEPREPNQDAIASLAAIVQNRQQTTSNTRPSPTTDEVAPVKKRKQKPLGRAVSSMNRSFSGSGMQMFFENPDGEDERPDVGLSAPAPPSTQLGYETLETEAHRQQMGKKMGLAMDDNGGGKRVASLGTVKDAEGKGGNTKGVRRTARK